MQYIQRVRFPSHIQGGAKVHPENLTLSNAEKEFQNPSGDFERRLLVDPVYERRYSTEGKSVSNYCKKLSNDPVLNSITSDLDYILNQKVGEFGSLKRGAGYKGILKKTSSYGKSCEDLRADGRTNL